MRQLLLGVAAGCALWASAGQAQAWGPKANGCDGCGDACKPSFFDKWKGDGCGDGCGGGCHDLLKNNFFMRWLRKPCPSGAPSLRSDYPLGFPAHPYIRSPRDWFMDP
jgi:hypothetical protein